MQKLKSLAIGVGLIMVPALAMADVLEGHFSGHADNGTGVGGSYSAGSTYDVYLVLDAVQTNPWYPWNAAEEYTAVLNTTVSSFVALGGTEVINFAIGAVNVYEDHQTAADYGDLGSFTDGTLILSGEAQNMIGERQQIFGLPFNVTGVVVFDGGDGFGNLECTAGLLMNDFIDFQFATNPAGFEEAYDAEWKCEVEISVGESTWGNVKGLYR
jgi:hypothetical protein